MRILRIIQALLLLTAMGSCTTTKYVPVIERHTDTLIHTQHHRDSIYVHDSTYVCERGDTLYIERWHTAWCDRVRTDTVRVSHTDSVPVPYKVEVVKEVPAPLTWWQKIRIGFANVALLSAVLMILVALIKNKIK